MLLFLMSQQHTAFATTYKYDEIGRVIEVSYDNGQVVKYVYDKGGNIEKVESTTTDEMLTELYFVPTSLLLEEGKVQKLILKGKNAKGVEKIIDKGMNFSVDNPESAEVDESGVLKALKKGNVIVSAVYMGLTANLSLEVTTYVDKTPPSMPQNLKAVNTTETSIRIGWQASKDNIGVVGYKIFRDGFYYNNTSEITFEDTNLPPKKTYKYQILAYDEKGNESIMSSELRVATKKDTQAPTVPANLKALELTEATVKFSWDESTDNVKLKGYNIYLDGKLKQSLEKGIGTYEISGLKPNTAYKIGVLAVDDYKNSSKQVVLNIKTKADTVAPTKVINISSTLTKPNLLNRYSATTTWRASTDAFGVKGYEIYLDGNKYSTTKNLNYKLSWLKKGVTYKLKVRAYDNYGNYGEMSDEIIIISK